MESVLATFSSAAAALSNNETDEELLYTIEKGSLVYMLTGLESLQKYYQANYKCNGININAMSDCIGFIYTDS